MTLQNNRQPIHLSNDKPEEADKSCRDAPFLIATGEIMDGVFPPKAKAMVKEFVLKYQKELNEMWETEEYRKLPPLD